QSVRLGLRRRVRVEGERAAALAGLVEDDAGAAREANARGMVLDRVHEVEQRMRVAARIVVLAEYRPRVAPASYGLGALQAGQGRALLEHALCQSDGAPGFGILDLRAGSDPFVDRHGQRRLVRRHG